MSNTNKGMGAGTTVTLHEVKPHVDGPAELYLKPENALVRFNQMKEEWGEHSPSIKEVEVIDTRPEWGFRG